MSKPSDERLSRRLSAILRHQALCRGLSVGKDGFVELSELLALPDMIRVAESDVFRVVSRNCKQRFQIVERDGSHFIRANQGHSMTAVLDEFLLEPVVLSTSTAGAAQNANDPMKARCRQVSEFPICVHGTSADAWPLIALNGLRRMSRNHIHFATNYSDDRNVVTGLRHSSEVLIFCNLGKAVADGIPFFVSANKVLLTPGIAWNGVEGVLPPQYFLEVVNRQARAVSHEAVENGQVTL